MKKLKEEFKVKYDEFINTNNLTPGVEAVPVDRILAIFQEAYPQLPVTKSLLGRALSQSFLKKQLSTASGLTQCYYLNKCF